MMKFENKSHSFPPRAASLMGSGIMLAAAVAALICTADAAEVFMEKTDLFKAGEGGYVMYRIPGVSVTPKGTILVHCEGRQGGGDWGQQDILLRRSTDGGRTWTGPRVVSKRPPNLQPNPAAVKQGLTKADKVTAHNAVCIVDRQTGLVHMLYGIEYARFFRITSGNEGESWTEPVEITVAMAGYRKDYPWVVVGNGCGHGIQLASGPHRGRILVAFWFSVGTGGHAHRPSNLGVLYSDDHAESWRTGAWICRDGEEAADGRKIVNPSETMLAELPDGRVLANIRSESAPNRRLVACSQDGGASWGKPAFQEQLAEPICMASLVRLPDGGLLFSNPDNLLVRGKPGQPGRNRERRNLTVRLSRDEGKSWSHSRPIEQGFSGYSDLGILPDSTLLCFYERGAAQGNHYSTEFLTLARFNLTWLAARTEENQP